MPTPRFYLCEPLPDHACIPLPAALSHYALRVLRLAPGSAITLFNGEGGETPAVLAVDGATAQARLGTHRAREAELAGRLCLVQGLATGDKMDWIVEKAVELGAHELVPIAARYSTLQLRGERLEKRLAHWRRVAQAASEQCGRNRIMAVHAPRRLDDYLRAPPVGDEATLRLLCHPEAEHSLDAALTRWPARHGGGATPPRLELLVGPEGGWSDEEIALATQAGAQVVRFGARILRTETAGLALMSACTALLGWNEGGPA